MRTNTDITAWVQETLNELVSERLIPFKLIVQSVNWEGREYVISFHDSLHSVRFSWTDDRPFKGVVRAAVLDSVTRLSQPANALGATIQSVNQQTAA